MLIRRAHDKAEHTGSLPNNDEGGGKGGVIGVIIIFQLIVPVLADVQSF